jgi:hypothetical protein
MAIPDLRQQYDETVRIKDGTLYRKGNVVQVWWERDAIGRPFDNGPTADLSKAFGGHGRETWTLPDEAQARRTYNGMIEDHPLPAQAAQ